MEVEETVNQDVLSKAIIDDNSFNISNTSLSNEEVSLVCSHLQNDVNHSTIILSNVNLTSYGICEICHLIQSNRTISSIDLSMNSFDGTSFSTFCRTLVNSNIHTAILDNTGLDEDTVREFMALKSAKQLSTLSLRNNALGNEGLHYLLYILQDCESLEILDVANNNITNSAFPFIADFIENTENIKKIDISGFAMDCQQCRAFQQLSEISDCEINMTIDYSIDPNAEERAEKLHLLNLIIESIVQKHKVRETNTTIQIVFSPDFALKEGDNETIMNFIQYPSAIATSLHTVSDYILNSSSVCLGNSIDAVVQLVAENIPLFMTLLTIKPYLKFEDSTNSVEVSSQIVNTAGPIERCGHIRIEIVYLFAVLMDCRQSQVYTMLMDNKVPDSIIELMIAFPWNSALHVNCVTFFSYMMASHNDMLLTYLFSNMQLHHTVATTLRKAIEDRKKSNKETVGYIGSMLQIAKMIQIIIEDDESIQELLSEDTIWTSFERDILYPMSQEKDIKDLLN